MQSEIDQRLGRFHLRALLGTGGFASVYRAEDTQLGRLVAIKVLHPHLAADEAFAHRFQAEARTAARLRHPHIVTVFEAGETPDGRGYLVMELLEGTLLSEIVARQGPLSFDLAVSILRQLASAIDYLHAHGLVHRDIKPSNIIVASDGRATLMDFGVARDLGDQAHLTRTGDIVGTPRYMAPEQIQDGSEVGPASDRYALGIVAYELLAGRPPFQGGIASVIHDQIATAPAPLGSLNLNLPPAAARAIEQMLAKEPEARPASAAIFMSLLLGEAQIEDLPTQPSRRAAVATARRAAPTLSPAASQETVLRKPGRPALQRRPLLLLGSGAVVVAVVIGLIWFSAVRRSGGGEGQLSVTSEPAGASVTVDGEQIGVTPLAAKKFSSGTHILVVEKPTYRSVKREESISAERAGRVNIVLDSLPTAELLRVDDDAEHQFIAWDVGQDASRVLRWGRVDNKVPQEQPFGLIVTLAQKFPGQRDLSFRYAFVLINSKGDRIAAKESDDIITFKKDDDAAHQEQKAFWAYTFASGNLPPGVYQVKFLVNNRELASKPVELIR